MGWHKEILNKKINIEKNLNYIIKIFLSKKNTDIFKKLL